MLNGRKSPQPDISVMHYAAPFWKTSSRYVIPHCARTDTPNKAIEGYCPNAARRSSGIRDPIEGKLII